MNGDGRTDVLLWYYPKSAAEERGLVRLVLSD